MGTKGAFAKSRSREAHQRNVRRAGRTQQARERRRGEDTASRLVRRVAHQRRPPPPDAAALLLAQFAQASRLAKPSADLCALIRHYAGDDATRDSEAAGATTGAGAAAAATPGHKRARDHQQQQEGREPEAAAAAAPRPAADVAALEAVAAEVVKARDTPLAVDVDAADDDEDDDDGETDPRTVLNDMLQDESGVRVVATLLGALHRVGSPSLAAVAAAVVAEFEENEHLSQHYVACRALSALVREGGGGGDVGGSGSGNNKKDAGGSVRQRVLLLMEQRAQTREALVELLRNRHTAVTVQHLLAHAPRETAAWLCAVLGLQKQQPPAAAGKKKAGKKAAEEAAEAASEETLLALINDPVSGQVMLELVRAAPRDAFLGALQVRRLLDSKRGVDFLTRLLTPEEDAAEGEAAAAAAKKPKTEAAEAAAALGALVDTLLDTLEGSLAEMAVDKRANFVVQRLVQLVPRTAPAAAAGARVRRVLAALGGEDALADLAHHAIGVYTVVALAQAALQLPAEAAEAAEAVARPLVRKDRLRQMLSEQHSSLVMRQLMPLVARRTASAAGAALHAGVEAHMAALLYDSIGNLVVQAYLRAVGQAGASAFARKYMSKESELLSASRHPAAAHVLFTLLELVDPATQAALSHTLAGQCAALATHVNGRFVVERLIAVSREVRDGLLRSFTALAFEKGTQHVLSALARHADARARQQMLGIIREKLRALALDGCGSITLQKLMQAEPEILAAVREALHKDPALRHELATNFHGKFVVQIALA